MATTWNGSENFEAISRAAARGLLAAAVLFENQQRQRVAKPNPPPYVTPSLPGEYPRLRTGAGQKALTHVPTTVEDVMRTGYVRVGYREGDHHLLILELLLDQSKRRLGLLKTLEDMRSQLAALAVAEFKAA